MGTITYTYLSPLSPEYRYDFYMGGERFSSPSEAIDYGYRVEDVLIKHVYLNHDIFIRWIEYTLRGLYSDILNDILSRLKIENEGDTSGWFIKSADPIDIPGKYTRRKVYLVEPYDGEWYRQIEPIKREELVEVVNVGEMYHITAQGGCYYLSQIPLHD